MNVKLIRSTALNDTIRTFYFKPDHPIRYVAGQFIELTIPHNRPDTRGQKRWFTLSSSPSENLLAVTTRIVSNSSTYKKALHNLSVGTEVQMSEAMGDFVLPKNNDIKLVFIAGGIGITPFRSMVKWLIDTNTQRTIQLVYSVRNEQDMIFNKTFHQPSLSVFPHSAQNMLNATTITELIGGIEDKQIYIAGPENMTEALVAQFKTQGTTRHQIVTDYFPGYTEL